MATVPKDWRCPSKWNSAGDLISPDYKLGWLREAIQQGRAYLEGQRAFEDMNTAIELISGSHEERIPSARSRLYVNRLKRQIREVVATEANIRPLWGYRSDNREFDDTSEILNKLLIGWWLNTFADRKVREALQYAGVLGTGYVSPIWEKDFWFAGRGDIALHTYGPLEVLPIQMPRDHDLQRCYAVALCTEVPIAEAHAMYPEFADLIKPSRERPGWIRRGVQKLRRFMAPALNVRGPRNKDTEEAIFPVVDLYHVYIMDLSVNQTGKRIPMGTPGTNWYYEAPFVGEDIPVGYNDSSGQALYRKATREDALLYPRRRLMVATPDVVISDDASPWWHGKVPAVRFTTDDWPWEALGFSLTRDASSLQNSIVELLRQIQDSGNVRMRPGLQYDGNVVSKTTMDRLDTRSPGGHLDINTSMGDFVKPLLPPEYYEVPSWIPQHIESLEQRMDYLMAVPDMASIAKARQIPSSDSMEKLMEMAGPIIQDISRGMERSLRDLGEQVKCLFFQFYNINRRIPLLGKAGTTLADWDYDPGTLVPDNLSGRTRAERAQGHMNQFVFYVTPNSLHQITQMSRQLLFLQLYRAGFPIDPWTLAESLDIPNFGAPPDGAIDVYSRWKAFMLDRADLMQAMQMLAATGAAGPIPGVSEGGNPPGRPPSGQQAPRIVQKDGGTRSTIAESR